MTRSFRLPAFQLAQAFPPVGNCAWYRSARSIALAAALLCCGAQGQAPDRIENLIYRDQVPLQDGYMQATLSLTADGQYSTLVVYYALSKAAVVTFHQASGRNETGTYIYRKSSPDTATLTFSPAERGGLSEIATERTLTFETQNAGKVLMLRAGGSGQFWLNPRNAIPLVNVSTRGMASSTNPLIVGFVVSGHTRDVLIRAIGPSLRQFGVADAADDTTLELTVGNGQRLQNDDWADDPEGVNSPSRGRSTANSVQGLGAFVGAFPLVDGSKDAAYTVRLSPGSYTFIVRTKSAEPAEVLGEAYVLP